jgi:hypothetical protein
MKPNFVVALAFAVGIITAAVAQPEELAEDYSGECTFLATDVAEDGGYDDWCDWLYAARGKR